MTTVDFTEQELAVGDWVVAMFPGYRTFMLAQVVGFTPKMVKIEYKTEIKRETKRKTCYASELVKISEEQVTLMALKGKL